ncbi:hypothetical protein MIND_01354100 [Mycena indigotica]|uniref:F-box domain-containing protein n=1 Tax=Mycena indigotica TaxID=2126181 RepID=A0A8H6RZH3_9AGAR|nr:uncharacterized protein MIND_01354100 [Mycena indigotica]KAF7289798.1 hypothetical protein MIND_01354100 [Mycena indigotica]
MEEAFQATQPALLDVFPAELLVRVLSHLSYDDLLLVVPLVCRAWQHLVNTDPLLKIKTFKKASDIYVDIGLEPEDSDESLDEDEDENEEDKEVSDETKPEPVVLHPLLGIISYMVGEDIQSLRLYHNHWNCRLDELVSYPAANDLATIPAVHSIWMYLSDLPAPLDEDFPVKVSNPSGVTVLDIFLAFEETAQQMVETADDGMMTVQDALRQFLFYSGFSDVKRRGRHLTTRIVMSS